MLKSLEARILEGSSAIMGHHMSRIAKTGWTAEQRAAYTILQYGFAVVWPAFLGAVADRVKTPELKKAISSF